MLFLHGKVHGNCDSTSLNSILSSSKVMSHLLWTFPFISATRLLIAILCKTGFLFTVTTSDLLYA